MDNPSENTRKNLGLRIFLIVLAVAIVGIVATIVVLKVIDNNKVDENLTIDEYNDKYFAEVDRIYDNNPENIVKVVDYFTEKINANKDDDMKMNDAIAAEIKWFDLREIENNAALLEGLTRIDYSYLIEEEQYAYYSKIIELAEELEETEIAEKYRGLRDGTQDEYLRALEATKANIELMLENMELDTSDEYVELMQQQYEDIVKKIEQYKEENE